MDTILDRTIVLDLSRDRAGAYATGLLAGFGAQVIKIEPPLAGDPLRLDGPFASGRADGETGAPHLFLNAGKQSVTLDIGRPDGRALLEALLQRAVVLVDSRSAAEASALSLTYESLGSRFPHMVVTSITPFGRSGPYADVPATELTLEALAGWTYLIGDQDREPLRCGADVGHYLTGTNAAMHTLAALWHREATGQGQHVDVSVLETLCVMLGITGFFSNWTHDNQIRVRNGQRPPVARDAAAGPTRRMPWAGATTMLPCADGWLAIAAQSAAQWEGLCTMIGRPDLVELARGADGEIIERTREETEVALIDGFKDKTRAELFELGGMFRCPTGIAYDVLEIAADPHLAERGFFRHVEHPLAGMLAMPGSPWEFGAASWAQGRAPLLGEHNEAVYGELLGLSKTKLARLHADDVI